MSASCIHPTIAPARRVGPFGTVLVVAALIAAASPAAAQRERRDGGDGRSLRADLCVLENGADDARLEQAIRARCPEIVTPGDATVTIRGRHAVPAPSRLTIRPGARWVLEKDADVVLGGGYDIAPRRTRVFSGPGRISATDAYDDHGCPTTPRVAYPEWFGAVPNDGRDDSPAINQALQLGNDVVLASGRYDLGQRIWVLRRTADGEPLKAENKAIRGGQTLRGTSQSDSVLRMMENARLVGSSAVDPKYDETRIQDFIVGMSSDCAKVSSLTIDGSAVPDNLSALSDLSKRFECGDRPNCSPKGNFPLVTGIQISSRLRWRKGEPPVRRMVINDITIKTPPSSCINMQSDRAAHDLTIDRVTCTARSWRVNTAAFVAEAYHPTYANTYENIRITNSSFTGGQYVFNIRGVAKLTVDNVTAIADPQSWTAGIFYTSDNGHETSAVVRRSRFEHMRPGPNARAVVEIIGRGYSKDREDVMPYLKAVPTSLRFEDTKFLSATHPAPKLIPLIRDIIGFASPVEIVGGELTGGNYAILAGDPAKTRAFGGEAFVQFKEAGKATEIRDVSDAELRTHDVRHSTFVITNRTTIQKQALSAVLIRHGALQAFNAYFYNIGTSPSAANLPIIDLGVDPPRSGGGERGHFLADNTFSSEHATTFVEGSEEVLKTHTKLQRNGPFVTAGSRPVHELAEVGVRD